MTRQVPPPCQPSTLGGDCLNDDGDDDGGGDDDDDCDGDDDDDDGEEEEEEGCHVWHFAFFTSSGVIMELTWAVSGLSGAPVGQSWRPLGAL